VIKHGFERRVSLRSKNPVTTVISYQSPPMGFQRAIRMVETGSPV